MDSNNLKCPSCSGQMVIAEAKPGDKIAKCQYCDTVVDLPDDHENVGFDINNFLGSLDLSKLKSGTTTTITTTTISQTPRGIVSFGDSDDSNEEVEDPEKLKEMRNKIKDLLKKSIDSNRLNDSLDVDGSVDLSE
jgi:hypothetical protein